jgi:putative membrane protein
MKKITIILLALLGSAVSMSSCHKDEAVVYAMTNQDFVTRASSNIKFEIAAGNLAKNRGVSDSVKSYGNAMVSDNTKMSAALASVASQKGYTLSANLLAADQDKLTVLSSLNGAAFDQTYAQSMIETHQQAAALYTAAAQNNGIPDQDLRGFAFGQLSLLDFRLQGAYNLQIIVNKH